MTQGYVRISVLTNEVFVDGAPLALGDREGELMTLLALCGGFADAVSLATSMWPNAQLEDGLTDLWACVTSLHKALPDPSILYNDKDGYALEASISVDLWEIDAYLRSHRYASRPRTSIDNVLYRRLAKFHYTHRYVIGRWAWSASLRSLIERYRRDVGLWLGWGLLNENRVYQAHSIALQLLAAYPSCATARGLLEAVERRLADAYLVAVPKAG